MPNAMDVCNGGGNIGLMVPREPIQPINRSIPVPRISAMNIVVVPFCMIHIESETHRDRMKR